MNANITLTEARAIRGAWIAAKPTEAQEDSLPAQELAEQFIDWAMTAARQAIVAQYVVDHPRRPVPATRSTTIERRANRVSATEAPADL